MEASKRRYDLYNLRIVAFALVFIYHVLRVFSPFKGWPVQNADKSLFAGLVNVFLEPHITIFFMIAGAGTWFSLKRRSPQRYAIERFVRLFLPLLVGSFVLVTPQVYYERLHFGEFEGTFIEFYPSVFTSGLYPTGNLGWFHLWFLAYLLAYSLIAIPLLIYFRSTSGKRFASRLADFVEKPGRIFLLFIPLAITEIIFRAEYPGFENLVSDWANFTLYFWTFLIGYLFMADERFQQIMNRYWRWGLAGGLVASTVTMILFAIDAVPTDYSLPYAAHRTVFAFGVWCWLICFRGVGYLYFNKSTAAWQYLLDISFAFYVFHQTLVVAFAFYVVQWDSSIFTKAVVIFTASLASTLVLCELVKLTRPTRFLFGIRDRRPEPPRQAPAATK